jgi:N-formylglutamate amidohydrolase
MAERGPPIGPGPGIERPWICLSNADGACPQEWLESMAKCFRSAFGQEVALNSPFKGGYTIRRHASELPWIQLELSRAGLMPNREKRGRVLQAMKEWCNAR